MTLRPSQLETLRVVAKYDRFGDGCGATDLVCRLHISDDAAERRLRRLGLRGLVEEGHPLGFDGGPLVWKLTDQGRRILREQEGPERPDIDQVDAAGLT